MNVFIIGVPHKYRGYELEERLKHEGLDFSRIDGTDGSRMSNSDYCSNTQPNISRRLMGRHLTKGELCCAMAHIEAYKLFLGTHSDWALILEDDCELSAEFKTLSLPKQIKNKVPVVIQLYGVATYLEQVKRWPWIDFVISRQLHKEGLLRIRRSWELPDCTYGYLINRAAAELAVKDMKNSRHVTTADWPAQWRGKVTFMILNDPLVRTRESISLIDFERVMARSKDSSRDNTEIARISDRAKSWTSASQVANFRFSLRMFFIWVNQQKYLLARRGINLGWFLTVLVVKAVRFFTSARVERS